MSDYILRRRFLKSLAVLPAVTTVGMFSNIVNAQPPGNAQNAQASKLKISLNAFSFNDPLTKATMNLDDMLEFCAASGFDAVDLTGYYFPGYPAVPSDEYLYTLKRKAFVLGLDISGTGVRNDFTDPDESKRKADIKLVKNWIEVAAKIGAPVIRIFAGVQNPKGFTWEQVTEWMVMDIRECVEYGKKHGVIVGIQNHNDFIKTADQAETIVKKINSEWFGIILDIGSYRSGDPYKQIAQSAPYAVNWQIKENMYENNVEVKTDLAKVFGIIKSSPYRGYLPIETLGAGDPKVKVPAFLEAVRKALG
ncbi:MAG: sugar phosphate isomerase/epimerase family protein [Chitinophagaceae bacterium]